MNGELNSVVVTGASSGIGAALAHELAARGHEVVMAVRNIEKGEVVYRSIRNSCPEANLHLMELDLARLDSIREFPRQLQQRGLSPSVLVNNAGLMSHRLELTEDGFEMCVGVNYVAPWLLTRRMIEEFSFGKSLFRVVNTTSMTYRWGKVHSDFFHTPSPRHYRLFPPYMRSKLAVLIFTAQLADRFRHTNVVANAVDPGVVSTSIITMHRWFDPLADLLVRPLIKTPAQGALPALHATENREKVSGMLFKGEGFRPIPMWVKHHPMGDFLWNETERRCGV